MNVLWVCLAKHEALCPAGALRYASSVDWDDCDRPALCAMPPHQRLLSIVHDCSAIASSRVSSWSHLVSREPDPAAWDWRCLSCMLGDSSQGSSEAKSSFESGESRCSKVRPPCFYDCHAYICHDEWSCSCLLIVCICSVMHRTWYVCMINAQYAMHSTDAVRLQAQEQDVQGRRKGHGVCKHPGNMHSPLLCCWFSPRPAILAIAI